MAELTRFLEVHILCITYVSVVAEKILLPSVVKRELFMLLEEMV